MQTFEVDMDFYMDSESTLSTLDTFNNNKKVMFTRFVCFFSDDIRGVDERRPEPRLHAEVLDGLGRTAVGH